MSEDDRSKRQKAQNEKRKKLINPLFFVSAHRLSVRNLAKTVTDNELKTLCISALKTGKFYWCVFYRFYRFYFSFFIFIFFIFFLFFFSVQLNYLLFTNIILFLFFSCTLIFVLTFHFSRQFVLIFLLFILSHCFSTIFFKSSSIFLLFDIIL